MMPYAFVATCATFSESKIRILSKELKWPFQLLWF